MAFAGTSLHWSDIVVIICYFVGVLAVGLWSARKSKGDSISGYFLASKNMHWVPVGASLFASNIGSGHFIGLAGSAAASGIAISVFELNGMFVLMILGWIFVPVYMASGVYTMPEYLRKRFGRQRIRIYLSVLALILYVFTKISADLFAGAIFIEEALHWDLYAAVILLLAIAALFTISGGLTAVIWTDFAQTILMVIGAFILMFLSFSEVGGYTELTKKFFFAEANITDYDIHTNESCGKPPDYSMHFFRDPTPGKSDLPWTGLVFGLTISAVWYWCSDQVIVQRALAAKTMVHAKGGCILAAYLKFLPLFLLVFPGMAARILYTEEVGCANAELCKEICGNPGGCTNIAYPRMVVKLMPNGLRGMMLSVMLAALMSSLTSIFNSASTIFTLDVYQRIRHKASEIELLIVGRVFVLVLVGISIIWIPVIQASKDSQLFNYIQSITSFLSPPICAVYVLALAWDRINEPGAFWGLMGGLVIGLIRFGLEFGYTVPPCGSYDPDPRPEWVKRVVGDIHYLHFGCILFVIVCIITISVSLMTPPIPKIHLYRLTYATRYSKKPRVDLDELEEEEERKRINAAKANGDNFQQVVYTVDKEAEAMKHSKSTQSVLEVEEIPTDVSPPLWRKLLNFVCGVDTSNVSQGQGMPLDTRSPEEKAAEASSFMEEHPFWSRVVNLNAIICMVFAGFIFGYYA